MSTPEWLEAHKGPLRRVVGRVWWCGDDVCDCTQAVITEEYQNKVDPRFIVPVGVWEGTFYSDGETGALADLIAERERMRVEEPDREASIEWLYDDA